jgi:hypothetical protein
MAEEEASEGKRRPVREQRGQQRAARPVRMPDRCATNPSAGPRRAEFAGRDSAERAAPDVGFAPAAAGLPRAAAAASRCPAVPAARGGPERQPETDEPPAVACPAAAGAADAQLRLAAGWFQAAAAASFAVDWMPWVAQHRAAVAVGRGRCRQAVDWPCSPPTPCPQPLRVARHARRFPAQCPRFS